MINPTNTQTSLSLSLSLSMGHTAKLRDIIGLIKDKASQSKATLLSKSSNLSLQLALLRATNHDPFDPPNDKNIATILSSGHSSRATASTAIEAIMDRLQSTGNSSVALKCLITVHHIVKYGSFILQDQLSVYPSNGGRNYLKLSNFRDNSSPISWELSSWVRWYAKYVETLLFVSRVLGFFLASSSNTTEKDNQEEKISSFMNKDLLKEIVALVGLMEEICKRPDYLDGEGNNKLVDKVMGFVGEDYLSAINEVSVRVSEFKERLSDLSFGDSIELVCALKRLEDCKERLLVLSTGKKSLMESFWGLISEVKDRVGPDMVYKDEGKLVNWVRREKMSESARFGERVLISGDSVGLPSRRPRQGSFSYSRESKESYT